MYLTSCEWQVASATRVSVEGVGDTKALRTWSYSKMTELISNYNYKLVRNCTSHMTLLKLQGFSDFCYFCSHKHTINEEILGTKIKHVE